MGYISKKDKARKYIEEHVLTALQETDLNFNAVVNYVVFEFSVPKDFVENIFYFLENQGMIKILTMDTTKCITIPDSKVIENIRYLFKKRENLKKMDEEMDKIGQLVPRKEVK